MSISEYLVEHWGMLIMLIGLSIVLYSDKHLEHRMINRMAVTVIMIFVYSITCHIETYLGNQDTYTIARSILSAVNYSLVTFLLVNIIMIVYPEEKRVLYIPAILNTILCFFSIFTRVVFWIDTNNHFQRGPLGYLTYFVNGMYLLYLLINLLRNKRRQKEEYPLIIFLAATSTSCLVMPLFMGEMSLHWFNISIAINIMLYYIYLLQQYTKKDPLTKLLNRQSFYSDSEKYYSDITAFVTMDMDGLKKINDNEGHIAGDIAIKTVADCFWNASKRKQRVYRVGGDEYVILCLSCKEDDVKALIDRIRQEIGKTRYSCSIGYAMKEKDSTIDSLYKLADSRMYEEKKKYYERIGRTAR